MAILTVLVVGWVVWTPYVLHGLTRSYYENAEWAGQPATAVRDRTLRLEAADFPWYGTWYSVEWTGVIYIPVGGLYRFALTSDDGSGLWIDESLVIDNGGMHTAGTLEGRATLKRGFHHIRVRYSQYDDAVAFSASWRPPGGDPEKDAPLSTAMLLLREPSPVMFGAYRVGRALLSARGWVLLGALVVSIGVGALWVLAPWRSKRQWSKAVGHAARGWAVRAFLVAGSLAVAVAGAEVALRIVYRDNGRTTSEGPGGARFDHAFPPWSTNRRIRGPNAVGPKAAGTTRVLVQGDSITWGQGVSDWTQLYPARLLAKLQETGSYDMTVLAQPGRGIDGHMSLLDQTVEQLAPDVIIYQWFANDVVLYQWFRGHLDTGGRPSFAGRWSQWRYHETVRERSFLYWLIFRRASDIVTSRSYADYARHIAKDGSRPWHYFRTQFHRWATRASAHGRRVVLLQYPVLPALGEYPLADMHQRLATAAGKSVWSQPAHAAEGRVGTNAPAVESRYGAVRRGERGTRGELVSFRDLTFGRGQHQATFWLRSTDRSAGAVARVEVRRRGQTLVAHRVRARDLAPRGEWQPFTVRFGVNEPLVEDISLRVVTLGRGRIEVDRVDVPTDYGIEVVDPMPALQDFDTWASPFDAHPNARAHAVLADILYERLASILSRDVVRQRAS
jgi:hypothetical protein